MPHVFEDRLTTLCRKIDRLIEQIEDLRGRGTVVYEIRDGVRVNVTDIWLQELEHHLDQMPDLFEKLLNDNRNSGDWGA